MKLCSGRSAWRGEWRVIVPVLALAALFFGCGRTPPEAFWEPAADDTAAIQSLVRAERGRFVTGLAELALGYMNTDLPGTTDKLLAEELTSNPFKQRFRVDSMQHVFTTDSLEYTFIAGLNLDSLFAGIDTIVDTVAGAVDTTLDTLWTVPKSETTATVSMAETIPGIVRMHVYGMTRFLRDTAISSVANYNVGYATGPGGRIWKTTDAGASWAAQASGTSADLKAASFPLDFFIGYVCGSGGTILKTTNGASWSASPSGTSADLEAVWFPLNVHTGFAVGAAGTVVKTVDGGGSWTALSSGTSADLNSVYFIYDRKNGIVVGDAGTILKTTNGNTFTLPTSGTTENLHAVWILGDYRTAVAVGANGTALRSTDAGSNWAACTLGTSASLNAVCFFGNNNGYIVGDGGTAFKTTNGGANWTTLTTGTTANLEAVSFPMDGNAGFAVGAGGVTIRTTDAGATWTQGSVSGQDVAGLAFGAERDTLVILPLHDTAFTDTNLYIEKEVEATTVNGCVLKKTNNAWGLWKLSGASRLYAPTPEDAPYIVHIYTVGPGGTDTIFLRPAYPLPETLQKYYVQGFYEPDSVFTFSGGESLRITGFYTNVGDAADYAYLVRDTVRNDSLIRQFHRRYEFPAGVCKVKFDSLVPPGRYKLFIEHIPIAFFWDPSVKYTATVWGIPIVVR
jgi:photosystem II stability/assembly factor-like uncharacterized protein